MKFFLMFFDNLTLRPFSKFSFNLFFLKHSMYFNFKNLIFINFFTNINKRFTINLLKFSYTFYKNFIIYFIIVNLLFQICLIVFFI